MDGFLQALINGLLSGGVYALVALGLGISFGVLKLFNFAHGEFLMVGMFSCFFLFTTLGLDPYLGIIIVGPALFVVGYLIQHFFINRLVMREPLEVKDPASILLFTFGVSSVLVNLFATLFSANYKTVSTTYSVASFHLGALNIPQGRLFSFILAAVMTGLCYLFFTRSYQGKAIRALSMDRLASRMMGIDDYRLYALAFALSCGILGVAAGSLTAFNYITPYVGTDFLTKSFIIVVLAGVGRLEGIFFGGLIIGILEALFVHYMPVMYLNVFVLLVFLAILLLRPQGLFGAKA